MLRYGDCGWRILVFELISSKETLRTFLESKSAALSGFYPTCAIFEHPIESWQLESDGKAKPRIHSADTYQWTGVINTDDSLATRKCETFS